MRSVAERSMYLDSGLAHYALFPGHCISFRYVDTWKAARIGREEGWYFIVDEENKMETHPYFMDPRRVDEHIERLRSL